MDKELKYKNNTTPLSDEMYYNALNYGYNIISMVEDYMEFSVSLIEYIGIDVLPYCDYIYYEIASSVPRMFKDKLIDPKYGTVYKSHEEQILEEYEKIKEKKNESERKKKFRSNVDELQFLNIEYRNADEFKRVLDFVGSHFFLSPYNAYLVYLQKPDSTFVYNGNTWKNEHGRQPKKDAQKLITLVPFGPVQCVFDYADTEYCTERLLFYEDMEAAWEKILDDHRTTDISEFLSHLTKNLPTYGIFLDRTLKASGMFTGYTQVYDKKDLYIRGANPCTYSFFFKSKIRICINKRCTNEEAFYFICNELTARLCKNNPYDWKHLKFLNMTVKEHMFEIETVKWLVFRRLGIYNPNNDYLDLYCADNKIPICSLERIMKATTELEKMMSYFVEPTESLLYKKDKNFKNAVDSAIRNAKERYRND